MNNPIQPLVDVEGVTRFKENAIVRHLIDTHPACDMNKLATLDFSDDDRQQFAQLIGYSLSGYCSLSYVDDVSYYAAGNVAEGLSDKDARIAALEQKLVELRAAIGTLRGPVAVLFEMHPDDLKAQR